MKSDFPTYLSSLVTAEVEKMWVLNHYKHYRPIDPLQYKKLFVTQNIVEISLK